MKKKLFISVLVFTLMLASKVYAFGPGFSIKFGGNETTIQAYEIMNGNNSQGTIPIASKKIVKKAANIPHYQIVDGLYVVEIDTNNYTLEPYVAWGLETNENVYKKTKALAVVNAGYFDPNNKQTISYVVKDGKLIANPEENKNLINNENLRPYLDTIFNRSEFRVLQKGRKIKYDIAKHNDPVEAGWSIKHSIQGGPMLSPELTAVDEYFLALEQGKVIRDAISVTQKVARTVLAIKEDKLYIVIATTKCPLTLTQMSDLCHKLGFEKAINFDGGGSTSFDSLRMHIVSDKNSQARKLKSFWLVK